MHVSVQKTPTDKFENTVIDLLIFSDKFIKKLLPFRHYFICCIVLYI